MVICIGVGLTLLGPWLPRPGLWAVLWLLFPVPGMWACLLVYVSLSWAVGFLLDCLCWLCPYVGIWYLFIKCFLCSG